MPQPPRKGATGFQCGPEVYKHLPHFAVGVASITSVWSEVEALLRLAVSKIANDGADENTHNFEGLPKIEHKISRLKQLVETVFPCDANLITKMNSIAKDIISCAKKRNKIVHNIAAYNERHLDTVFFIEPIEFFRMIEKSTNPNLFSQIDDIQDKFLRGVRGYKIHEIEGIRNEIYGIRDNLYQVNILIIESLLKKRPHQNVFF